MLTSVLNDLGWSASLATPRLLIPQTHIVRQKPKVALGADIVVQRKKPPIMMKPVKSAAPVVNLTQNVNPPMRLPLPDGSPMKDEEQDRPHVEYDPAIPNEYLQLCRDRRAERDRLQRERELQEILRLQELKQEKVPVAPIELNVSGEDAYMRRMRMSGVLPAEPTSSLPTPPRSPSPEPERLPVSASSTKPIAKQSVAERLMAKMGWSDGQGLGAQNQGIRKALVATKRNTGHVVVVEPGRAKRKRSDEIDNYVMLLENMVGTGEVDSDLERETAEECARFGKVEACRVSETRDQVRIFVQFAADSALSAALDAMNGRLFGGRKIRATSYDSEAFAQGIFDL